jgi:hypothetical protein
MIVVGEIGRTPNELKHELKWWEIKSIIRGYNRRHRDLWSATRWQTYHLMCAQVGGDKLSSKGINGLHDLLPLPWDDTKAGLPTPEEVDGMVAEINAINASNSKPKA